MKQTDLFAIPLELTGVLALAIVVVTARHNPWRNKYGTPTWDYSTSFATNLAALTTAINVVLAAATLVVDSQKKTEPMLATAVFAVLTACSPLLASAWKTSSNETYFAGVVTAILATGLGVFGQIQVLIAVVAAQVPSVNSAFRIVLLFGDFAAFLYCLSTANVIAERKPSEVPAKLSVEAQVPPQLRPSRWTLP
jgi:uncharacterized membrane protein